MSEHLTRLKKMLLDAYPTFNPGRPLKSLKDLKHPEVMIQRILDDTATMFLVSHIAIAHLWFSSITGEAGFKAARLAYDEEEPWVPEHRFILRRLSLAVLRQFGGRKASFTQVQVDYFALSILLTEDELEAQAIRDQKIPVH